MLQFNKITWIKNLISHKRVWYYYSTLSQFVFHILQQLKVLIWRLHKINGGSEVINELHVWKLNKIPTVHVHEISIGVQFLLVQSIINVGVVNIKCGCGLSSTYVYLLSPPMRSLKPRLIRYILTKFFQTKKPITPPTPTRIKRIMKVTPKIMPKAEPIIVFLGRGKGCGLLWVLHWRRRQDGSDVIDESLQQVGVETQHVPSGRQEFCTEHQLQDNGLHVLEEREGRRERGKQMKEVEREI